jgi:hypothetical protein
MSVRLWPVATLVLGIATLAAFLMLGRQPEVTALYGADEVASVVSDFQRAATIDDLVRVFGDPPNPQVIAAMDAVNRLDLWAFIPAYVLFLLAAAIMLAKTQRGPLLWAAMAFALVGAGADAIETSKQLALTADYENAAVHLPITPWYWLKYGALALNGFAVAGLCLLGAPRRWVMGIAALLPLPFVLAAFAGLIEPRVFSVAFTIYWLALLAIAVMETVRAKGASA